MHDAMYYVNWTSDFFKTGFAQINLTLAVLVAFYWAWRMSSWSSLVTTALGAVIMHIVAIVLAPMIDHNGPVHIPAVQDPNFWRFVAALFLGYTVVIGVLFLLKSMIMNRGGGEAEAMGGMLMAGAAGAAAGAVSHGTSDHHGGGHDDHGHGGGHDDHGHGDHGHGGGHEDHGHGGGHDDHGHGGGHGGHGHH